MPTALVARLDLDDIYPPFLAAYLELLARCAKRQAYYYGTLGTRTWPQQAALYAQGRTTPGPIVTNAPAGASLHNYYCATDNCRDQNLAKVGLQPYWGPDGYAVLKEEGERLGLQVGVPSVKGGDLGHVQLPLGKGVPGAEKKIVDQLRAAYSQAPAGKGKAAVWAVLDKLGYRNFRLLADGTGTFTG